MALTAQQSQREMIFFHDLALAEDISTSSFHFKIIKSNFKPVGVFLHIMILTHDNLLGSFSEYDELFVKFSLYQPLSGVGDTGKKTIKSSIKR